MDRDHLEISKPRTQDDQAYMGSTQLIHQILKEEALGAQTAQTPVTRTSGATTSQPAPVPTPAPPASTPPPQTPQPAPTTQVTVTGTGNITITGASAGSNINVGKTIQGDVVAGDKFSGDKVMGDKFTGNKITYSAAPVAAPPASAPGTSPLKAGPWRVFLSHTSELRQYPSGGSYMAQLVQRLPDDRELPFNGRSDQSALLQ